MYFSHSCTALIAHPQWQHSLTYWLSPQEDSELGLQEADELQVRCIGQIAVQGQLETEKQKHQSRARLHQEIKDKEVKRDAVTCPSKTKQKTIAERVETTPLAEMLLAHLQAVTCLRLRSVIDIVFNTRNTLRFTNC